MDLDPVASSPRPLADVLARLAADLNAPAGPPPLHQLVHGLCAVVPGAQAIGIVWRRAPDSPLAILAATDDAVGAIELRQAETGDAPALEALRGEQVSAAGPHLADRWPVLAAGLQPIGLTAVLALPLPGLVGRGSLNLYAGAPFGLAAAAPAIEAAAVTAVAMTADLARERADNLDVALSSSRQIASAVGIVMAQQRCSYADAFTQLRSLSQRTHRKIRELAEEVVFTGALPTCENRADSRVESGVDGRADGPAGGSVPLAG